MRTKLALYTLLFAILGSAAHGQGTWTPKANVGGSLRAWGIGFSIGHKGYIGLGTDNVNLTGALQDLWEYDPLTNAWTQRAAFGGGPRKGAAAFVVNGKAYVGTGADANSVQKNDLWQYTPSTNTWVQRASLGGVVRDGAVAFGIGGFGYLGTGRNGTTALNDFWRYDANANTWTQRANFAGGSRYGAATFVVNGFGYLGTGLGSVGGLKKDLWRFSPGGNTWSQMPDMTGSVRHFATGFSAGNFGYIAGGLTFSFLQDVWRFEPATSQWVQQTNLPIALAISSSFTIAGNAYVGSGGISGAPVTNFYEFTPASTQAAANTWTRKANFGGERSGAVGFSIGSKGYIGTGSGTKDFWEYNPVTNAWTQKANFGGTARSNAVGFSIGSRGYIGTGTDGTRRDDFWEYNPATNAWTQKANCGGTARSSAVGFAIGSKGYICAGNVAGFFSNDFWEYDPSTNAWTQRSDFGGEDRSVSVGFSIGSKGYMGTGAFSGGGFNDFWEYDPATNAWAQKANFGGTERFSAVGFSIGSKGFIGLGVPATVALTVDFWEYEPGPVNCSANQVTLALNTDFFSSETSWEIAPSGNPNPVCNGSGYASNSTISINCCLPDGCYDLRVFDSFGDGILSPGGFTLRDASNQRIVDNNGNGSAFTTLSQVTNTNGTPWSFCVPLGTDALVPASCDQVFTLNSTVTIQVQENPAVTAQLTANPATSGYQICIFDPNGGFRRNVFLSFSVPGTAFPLGTSNALKPTFFNLNFSQAPFLPLNKLLNVRVRGKVNGTFLNCGPACRLVVGTPPCTTTQLTTTASPQVSCGVTRSVNGGQLFCDLVPGANRYRFQFAGPNNYLRNASGPAAAVNSLASRTLTLSVFQQLPLPCGVPLTVRVQASFDGGTTYCPLGAPCTVTVTGCPAQQRSVEEDAPSAGLSIWPNPSDGSRLNIRLDGIAADVATVDLADAYGKLVRREVIPGTGSGINSVLDLGGDIAEGLYFVTITAGGETFTERVMIVR